MVNEEKHDIIKKSKISLILNDYNDLFSDFDPRSYSERSISHDFLHELNGAVLDKQSGLVEISLLVPRGLREIDAELVIKKRLRAHFKKHFEQLRTEKRRIRTRGLAFSILGAVIGVLAIFLSVQIINIIAKNAALILLEPASWFFMWNGLDHLFFLHLGKKSELDFYEKMTYAQISFIDY